VGIEDQATRINTCRRTDTLLVTDYSQYMMQLRRCLLVIPRLRS
jgi:hypothetical protein